MRYIRQDQAQIRVRIDGIDYFGDWYSFEGAALEVDAQKTRAGGMGSEVALGGPASRSDATVRTQFTDIVAVAHPTIESKVGWAPVSITVAPLAHRGDVLAGVPTRTYLGVLIGANAPDHDTGSGEVTMYELTVSLNETA